jgi:hypothetical protein
MGYGVEGFTGGLASLICARRKRLGNTTLETTQGQMKVFVSQLPYKCHLEEVASVGD